MIEMCDICGEVYENELTPEEQDTEARFMFGDRVDNEMMSVICESCFIKIYPDYFYRGGKV